MEFGSDEDVLALPRAPRVLVAEDDPSSQRLLELILTSLGYALRVVSNGREAVRALEADPYDVVLMELRMPVLDGLAAARCIRAMPDSRAGAPIIGLTSELTPATEAAALAAGVNACLSKPLDVTHLTATVAAWAGQGPRLNRSA